MKTQTYKITAKRSSYHRGFIVPLFILKSAIASVLLSGLLKPLSVVN